MPGSNNFLPFNPTDATNTDSDADYAAETQRTGGIQDGIAKTKMHNKFYRQVSVMATAIAQFMANQGQTVSDADVAALTTVIQNSFMQRGASALDVGIDASTYVWQNGVYTCSTNVANMPVAGHLWLVKAVVSDVNNIYLYAIDLTTAGNYYVREKIAGVWSSWATQAFALESDFNEHLAEIATPTQLGHVKAGASIAVAADGTMSATAASVGADPAGSAAAVTVASIGAEPALGYTPLPVSGGNLTGNLISAMPTVQITNSAPVGTFEVSGDATYPAVMTFHRHGTYGINFGIDTDNLLKLGGFSAGTNKYIVYDERSLIASTVAPSTYLGDGVQMQVYA